MTMVRSITKMMKNGLEIITEYIDGSIHQREALDRGVCFVSLYVE